MAAPVLGAQCLLSVCVDPLVLRAEPEELPRFILGRCAQERFDLLICSSRVKEIANSS